MERTTLEQIEEELYSPKTFAEQILLLNDAVAMLIKELKWVKEEIENIIDWTEAPIEGSNEHG